MQKVNIGTAEHNGDEATIRSSSSEHRMSEPEYSNVAHLAEHRRRLGLKVTSLPPAKIAEFLTQLEAENTELRCRAVELALEIHAMGGKTWHE